MRTVPNISRRAVLRGSGQAAVGLPLLDLLLDRKAQAAGTPPVRFVVFYTPGGTIREKWVPQGTPQSYDLRGVLAPLAAWKKDLVIVDGVDIKVSQIGFGHPHSRGMAGFLTGQPLRNGTFQTNGGSAGFADGPSIDQVLGTRLGADRKFRTLELAVRWSTGVAGGGKSHPSNQITYRAANQPVPPATDPRQLWTRLFRDVGVDDLKVTTERKRSAGILGAVAEQYTWWKQVLGRDDRLKLEAHLTQLREMEAGLQAAHGGGAACKQPVLDGKADDYERDAAIPATGKLMMDMLVMSLACDLTRVATMQWTDCAAKHTFPWLGLHEDHHAYQHNKGYRPEPLTTIATWYSEQFAYFLERMSAVKEGSGTLLDNTIVLWGSEIQHPNTHAHDNMPFILAGRGGGRLRSGRWLRYDHPPNNDLLVSLLNAFGVDARTFGHPDFCTGALPGLIG